jgi:hypothetical protein
MFTCPFCHRSIDPTAAHGVYQRVVGWEKRRSGGGTNAIALRRTEQVWAHNLCVERAKNGRSGQGQLG